MAGRPLRRARMNGLNTLMRVGDILYINKKIPYEGNIDIGYFRALKNFDLAQQIKQYPQWPASTLLEHLVNIRVLEEIQPHDIDVDVWWPLSR